MAVLGRHVHPLVLLRRQHLEAPLLAEEKRQGPNNSMLVVPYALGRLLPDLAGVAEHGQGACGWPRRVMERLQRRWKLFSQDLSEATQNQHRQPVGAGNERLQQLIVLLRCGRQFIRAGPAFLERDLLILDQQCALENGERNTFRLS